ncbi:MAG: phosphotransferase, partial [Gammaproteobacteria bacterium]|nr:phosphotransferase [Gammaproteobacteria bacterium]
GVLLAELQQHRRDALRLHRPGYHTFDELVSEQVWSRALSAAGIDVPVAKPTRDGAGYAEVTLHGEKRYAGMLEWVDGDVMYSLIEQAADTAAVAARFRDLGALMATMHNQAAAWVLPTGFARHRLDANGLMGHTPFWGRFWEAPALTRQERSQFADLRARIHGILEGLDTSPAHFSLIHADLHPGNIVVHGPHLHVIDFDDAGFGWHAYDLAVALKNFQGRPDFDDLRRALIEGYRTRRPLGDAAIDRLPLFLLIRALATIGWISARPELGHPEYVQTMIAYVHANATRVLSATPDSRTEDG